MASMNDHSENNVILLSPEHPKFIQIIFLTWIIHSDMLKVHLNNPLAVLMLEN